MSDWTEQIHGLADGELEGLEAQQAEQRCSQDAKAKDEYEWAVQCKQLLSTKCSVELDYSAKEGAYKRIGIINSREARIEYWTGKYAWALCTVFILVLAGAFWFNRMSPSQDVSPAFVASAFSSLVPEQRVSNERGDVPVDVQNVPYRMVGFGRGEIEGREAARIDFRDGYGEFSLLVFWDAPNGVKGMAEGQTQDGMCVGQLNDIPCVMWTEKGKTMILLGNRSHREFEAIAKTITITE